MTDRRTFLAGSAGMLVASTGFAKDECSGSKLTPLSNTQTAKAVAVTRSIAPGANNQWEVSAAVARAFQENIESNIRHLPDDELRRLLSTMSNAELNDLSYFYRLATLNSPKAPLLLEEIAARADLQNLARVGLFFGFADTYAATLKVAPLKASEFSLALSPNAMSVASPAFVRHAKSSVGIYAKPAPTVDMTLRQIYLDFRTAPVGSLSAKAALYETASFAGTRLLGAFSAGYTVGTGINYLWATYAPDSYAASSDLLGRSVDAFASRVSSLFNGFSLDNVSFSVRLQIGASQLQLFNSGAFGDLGSGIVFYRNGGDFNVSAPWADKMDTGCK